MFFPLELLDFTIVLFSLHVSSCFCFQRKEFTWLSGKKWIVFGFFSCTGYLALSSVSFSAITSNEFSWTKRELSCSVKYSYISSKLVSVHLCTELQSLWLPFIRCQTLLSTWRCCSFLHSSFLPLDTASGVIRLLLPLFILSLLKNHLNNGRSHAESERWKRSIQ